MARSVRSELSKLARISQLQVTEKEFDHVVDFLDARLAYTTKVNEILATHTTPVDLNATTMQNVFRADVATQSDAQSLLKLAPQREENYFIVPVIIKQK